MKKLFAIIMSTAMIFSLAACSREKEEPASTPEETRSTEVREREGIWEDAKYTEDTELGEGSKIVYFAVTAEDKTVNFTIHTDAETLGDALLENELVEGEVGDYGLFVDTVDGMYNDYSENQLWWQLTVDGEMASTGVDGVILDEETTAGFDLAA